MQLQTILNRIEWNNSYAYQRVHWEEQAADLTLQDDVVPRANRPPLCLGCQKKRPCYDHLAPRTLEYVPLWGIHLLLVYGIRWVACPDCRVVVEHVPCGVSKCRQTTAYRWLLARWARRSAWQEVACIFDTS